jgi:hypothetical protein
MAIPPKNITKVIVKLPTFQDPMIKEWLMQFVCICRIIGWHATLIFRYTMTTQCDAILKIHGTDQSHLGSHSKEAWQSYGHNVEV